MVAFKIESYIWYSVVLLIAISRLYDSPKPICTKPVHSSAAQRTKAHPHCSSRQAPKQIQKPKTDKIPNAAFRAVWHSAPFADTRPMIIL